MGDLNALERLLSWLGRKSLLYVMIVAAMLFALLAWPEVKASWIDSPGGDAHTIAQTKDDVAKELEYARTSLSQREKAIRGYGRARLLEELRAAEARLVEAQGNLNAPRGWLDTVRPSKILEQKKLEIRILYLNNEISALNSALAAADAGSALDKVRLRLAPYMQVPTMRAIEVANQACEAARQTTLTFQRKSRLERTVRNFWEQEAELVKVEKRLCSNASQLAARRQTGLRRAQEYRAAKAAFAKAQNWQMAQIEDVAEGLNQSTLADILKNAFIALIVILLTPYLIRVLLYFVFARSAEKRGAIRVNLDGSETEGITAAPSSISVALRLKAEEELLVRQGYLQTTSWEGPKETRWLLDWRRPLGSLASGLVFLTRVRGDGETTTISAVRDPFAEITTLNVPSGASCVLHPRALVAVAQPIDTPLRISSHWRLFSLNAWLTLQLRFLAFHGPAKLVIKGGRGIRVERAERGRVLGQEQLVGFSSDLAYSVSRAETFWPYFLGHEPLLKDRVAAGTGLLIIEEAPLASCGGRQRAGLEGAFDAFLKAFGL